MSKSIDGKGGESHDAGNENIYGRNERDARGLADVVGGLGVGEFHYAMVFHPACGSAGDLRGSGHWVGDCPDLDQNPGLHTPVRVDAHCVVSADCLLVGKTRPPPGG